MERRRALNPNQIVTIGYLVLLVGIFYFFLLRPQQKRAKEHRELIESLSTGDRVVTIGGIHGTLKSIGDDSVVLEIADGVRVTVSKSAVGRKLES